MNEKDQQSLNRIEELKKKLYGKSMTGFTEHRGGRMKSESYGIPDSWEKKEEKQEAIWTSRSLFLKTSMFKKFFTVSIIFFAACLILAGFIFYGGSNTVSNDNIEISVLGNAFASGGEDLPLQIEVLNKNRVSLQFSDLIVEYPRGSGTDTDQSMDRIRESIGVIGAGKTESKNVKVVLFGEQGSVKNIKISLEYRVEGSNAIFVKEKGYDVSINSAPVDLSLTAPDDTSPNQEINLGVKVVLNAAKPAQGMGVKLDYPPGFQFEIANPKPSVGNNVWDLGDLSPGAEKNISITGRIVDGQDGEEKTFHVFAGSKDSSNQSNIGVVYNSLAHTVAIKKPFIDAKLFVNGYYQKEYSTDGKSPIQVEVRWANNLPTSVKDVEITAKVSGSALDQKSISAFRGFYNSVTNTITWDKNSDKDLASVDPGGTGSAVFSMKPLGLIGSNESILSDPKIIVEVSIKGKQPLEGNIEKAVNSSESKVIKIISDLQMATKALYSSGPFTNTGPIPAKAEKETTYTITWSISNSSNKITGAQAKATLPAWVRFTNQISPPSQDLTYNPSTREILWNIGDIARGQGITAGEKEVSFQVAILPSISQIGTVPVLVNDISLTGLDTFANVSIRVNKAALNTRISSDPAYVPGTDRVVE